MKIQLERLAFTAVLGTLVAGAWLAVETEASTPARPTLIEVAAAAPVAVEAPTPTAGAVIEAGPELSRGASSAPATMLAPEEHALFASRADTRTAADDAAGPVTADPGTTTAAITTAVASAPAADEELATTSSDEASHDSIVVEHTIAAIPNPPDVGASGQRRTFEVETGTDAADPWLGVRNCESHNNYSINTGNGFYGAYQFTISSWDWVAGLIGRPDLIGVRPDLAAPWDQDRLAQALAFEVAGGGLQHWPVCGRFYG